MDKAKKNVLIRVLLIAAVVIIAAGAFVGGIFVGRSGQNAEDNAAAENEVLYCEVVYAEILSNDNGHFHVKGLDVNDINGRGEYTFSVKEDTKLVWRGTPLSVEDFDAGDRIAFYYNGLVLESHPAIVPNVIRIKLLDDEV